MRFPVVVVPNVSNADDLSVEDFDGKMASATDLFELLGGMHGLRLMLGVSTTGANRELQVTSQEAPSLGRVYCVAYRSGTDEAGRPVSGALVLRRGDLQALDETSFQQRLARYGLRLPNVRRVSAELEKHDRRRAAEKKKIYRG